MKTEKVEFYQCEIFFSLINSNTKGASNLWNNKNIMITTAFRILDIVC